MSYTLTIPEEVYSRARKIAEETEQSVEQVLIDHLKNLPETTLMPDEQEELDALRTIAREQMPQNIQERLLMMNTGNWKLMSNEETG